MSSESPLRRALLAGLLLGCSGALADVLWKNQGASVGPVLSINCATGVTCTRSGSTGSIVSTCSCATFTLTGDSGTVLTIPTNSKINIGGNLFSGNSTGWTVTKPDGGTLITVGVAVDGGGEATIQLDGHGGLLGRTDGTLLLIGKDAGEQILFTPWGGITLTGTPTASFPSDAGLNTGTLAYDTSTGRMVILVGPDKYDIATKLPDGGNWSGVGACGANTWASTLVADNAPTCTQPGFGNISGTLDAGAWLAGANTVFPNGKNLGALSTGLTLHTAGTPSTYGGVSCASGQALQALNASGEASSCLVPVTSVSGTSPLASSGGATPAISCQAASGLQAGCLSATDWTTFNNKGTVTAVTGTAPVTSSGGTAPAIGMPAATTLVNGYLTSTDWATFNAKSTAGVGSCGVGTAVSAVNSGSAPTCSAAVITGGNCGAGTAVQQISTSGVPTCSARVITGGSCTGAGVVTAIDQYGVPTCTSVCTLYTTYCL